MAHTRGAVLRHATVRPRCCSTRTTSLLLYCLSKHEWIRATSCQHYCVLHLSTRVSGGITVKKIHYLGNMHFKISGCIVSNCNFVHAFILRLSIVQNLNSASCPAPHAFIDTPRLPRHRVSSIHSVSILAFYVHFAIDCYCMMFLLVKYVTHMMHMLYRSSRDPSAHIASAILG